MCLLWEWLERHELTRNSKKSICIKLQRINQQFFFCEFHLTIANTMFEWETSELLGVLVHQNFQGLPIWRNFKIKTYYSPTIKLTWKENCFFFQLFVSLLFIVKIIFLKVGLCSFISFIQHKQTPARNVSPRMYFNLTSPTNTIKFS